MNDENEEPDEYQYEDEDYSDVTKYKARTIDYVLAAFFMAVIVAIVIKAYM